MEEIPLLNADATILTGAALSSPIRLGEATLVGIYVPAALDGAKIAFHSCASQDGTYVPVKSPLVDFVVGSYLPIEGAPFVGVDWLKLQTVDETGTAVTQSGDRVITTVRA